MWGGPSAYINGTLFSQDNLGDALILRQFLLIAPPKGTLPWSFTSGQMSDILAKLQPQWTTT